MQKFLDDMVGPITEPAFKRFVFIARDDGRSKIFHRFYYHPPFSPSRYLEYFIGLLSGDIKLNSLPLYLRFIKMESPPCMHHKISYHENEWSSFIKIFEGERFVFISGKRSIDLDIYGEFLSILAGSIWWLSHLEENFLIQGRTSNLSCFVICWVIL